MHRVNDDAAPNIRKILTIQKYKIMTKQEFEELIGGKPITDEAFDQINRIYMAIPEISKEIFCKRVVDNDGLYMCDKLVDRIEVLMGMLEERNNELEDCHQKIESLAEFLVIKSDDHDDYDLRDMAIELVGQRKVVKFTLNNDLKLQGADIDYLKALLNNDNEANNKDITVTREGPTPQESGENAI